MSRHALAAALSITLLAAGAQAAWSDDRGLSVRSPSIPGAQNVSPLYAFQCGTMAVQVRFHPGGAAELIMAGRTLTLPEAVSASGARYEDAAGNQFWSKGSDAVLTLAGQAAVDCTGTAP